MITGGTVSEVGGTIAELVHWLLDLDPPFAFLLFLPFFVGFAGLVAERIRRRQSGTR